MKKHLQKRKIELQKDITTLKENQERLIKIKQDTDFEIQKVVAQINCTIGALQEIENLLNLDKK